MPDSSPPSDSTRTTSVSVQLGALLAVAGGFLDAYTYVSRRGVFANSQTGNVVLFGVQAARGQWGHALEHVPPILAFLAGVAAAETLKRPALAALVRRPARAALVLEILVLLVVGALPLAVPDSVITVVIAFAASLQVSTFRTLIKWPYNTTMTTGNLRTFGQAVYLALVDGDGEAALRARGFGAVIVAFMGGAVLGGTVTLRFGARAIWAAASILAMGLALFAFDDWRDLQRRREPPPEAP